MKYICVRLYCVIHKNSLLLNQHNGDDAPHNQCPYPGLNWPECEVDRFLPRDAFISRIGTTLPWPVPVYANNYTGCFVVNELRSSVCVEIRLWAGRLGSWGEILSWGGVLFTAASWHVLKLIKNSCYFGAGTFLRVFKWSGRVARVIRLHGLATVKKDCGLHLPCTYLLAWC